MEMDALDWWSIRSLTFYVGRAESFPFSLLNISDIFRAFALDAEFQFGDDHHHQESDKRSNATTTKAGAHFALFFCTFINNSISVVPWCCSFFSSTHFTQVFSGCCCWCCCCSHWLPELSVHLLLLTFSIFCRKFSPLFLGALLN